MSRANRTELRLLLAKAHEELQQAKATVARELHDDITPKLTALNFEFSLLAQDLAETAAASHLSTKLEKSMDVVQELNDSVRNLMNSLTPAVLGQFGLVAAIEDYCADLEELRGLRCVLRLPDKVDIDAKAEHELWQIFLLTTSDARTKEASLFELEITVEADHFTMLIRYDGQRTDVNEPTDSDRLRFLEIEERIARIGGTLSVGGDAGGVELEIAVPARPSVEQLLA